VAEIIDADRGSLEMVDLKGGTDEVDLERALPPIRDAISFANCPGRAAGG
jgi:hypothetical protein